MQLSKFGQRFGANAPIVHLMEDLGNALRDNPDMLFMGGGNPAYISDMESVFERALKHITNDDNERRSLLGIYQSPQGDNLFRKELARYLNRRHGWSLSERNIAITNGSQPAFFVLYNLLAGDMPDGSHRKIHLPLTPEYLGYRDIGLKEDLFSATRPSIELLDNHQFKYRVDFPALQRLSDIAALCVSRPTNPTGNVLTDQEMAQLSEVALQHQIPLIVDGAYGEPFPGLIYTHSTCHWDENTVLVLSLSKLGLPGVRTGIVIGNEQLIEHFAHANALISLSLGNLGPAIGNYLLQHEQLDQLCQTQLKPHYQGAQSFALNAIEKHLSGLPYRLHKPEGAFFLWLWLENLPITSEELYRRLKARGLLLVPGQDFFIGLDDHWRHRYECVRLSYAANPKVVEQGITLLGEELRAVYQGV